MLAAIAVFALPGYQLRLELVAVTVHLVVLGLASKMSTLCAPRAWSFEDG